MKYEDLTPAEKRWMCNGCGPQLGIFPSCVPDFIFHKACDYHDFLYWLGKSAADRKAADEQFLIDMKALAAKQDSWLSRTWFAFLAYRYYAAVRAFGTGSFSFRDHYATHDDLVKEMHEEP